MAQLRLAPAPAARAPVSLGSTDAYGRCAAACTADGRLHMLAIQAGSSTADADTFAMTLMADGVPPKALEQPWAALALLPPASGGGLLCAQAGSGRLLCFQHPVAALELGQPGAEAFLLGCHQEAITAIAVSRCGNMALSADACGALCLWALADGAELAAVWGGNGSGPITAACFLCNNTVATARGSLVSVWRFRLGATPGLELAAELRVAGGLGGERGRAQTVAALASGARVLVAGCSNGNLLLWRQSSSGDWQQQPALTVADGTPATALAFSSDASLLAGAAGATAGIWCTASGQQLARQALPAAPVALFWTQAEQLLALTPGGALQPLGAPQTQQQEADSATAAAATAALATASAAAPQTGAAPAARQRKCVRFAEAPQAAPEAMDPALLLPDRPPAGRAGPPPPLPSHPLLRKRGTGSSRSGSPACSPTRKAAATIRGSKQPGMTPGTTAVAMPASRPSQVKPLYPILDLRALRGLQAAAPAPAASTAVPATCSVEQSGEPQQPGLAVSPALCPAAVCKEAGGTYSLQGKEQPPAEAAEVLQPHALASAPQPAAAADEEARPRQLRPPAPMQRQPSPTQLDSGTHIPRSNTCAVEASEAGSGRPASPAKQALLAQLAALRQDSSVAAAESGSMPVLCPALDSSASAADSCAAAHEAASCRPASPVKLGVACTRAAQEEGELQPQEVQAHTVLELEASLPLPAALRQRFARLSRRCTFGHPAGELAAVQPGAQLVQQAQQDADDGNTCIQFTASGPAAVASAAAGAKEGAEAAAAAAAVPAEGDSPTSHAFPAVEAATAQQVLSTACAPFTSAAHPALPHGGFAVGRDAELSSDDEQEGLKEPEPRSTRACNGSAGSPFPSSGLLPADAAAGAASEPSSGSLSETAAVRPRPVQPPAGRPLLQRPSGAPAARAAAGAVVPSSSQLDQVAGMLCQLDSRLSSLAARAQRQRQGGLAEQLPGTGGVEAAALAVTWPAHEVPAAAPRRALQPARLAATAVPQRHEQAEAAATQAAPDLLSFLAAPVLNSSLLRIQRAAALTQQAAATAAAPPPLPAEQAQAAWQRAATAATTLPHSARLFGPLPPPAAPPASKVSPSKQAALSGAKKQLDERWAAEQAELQPRLEHLWPPPWHRSAPAPLPLRPLTVPLPDRPQLAADFLGLRL